MGPSSLGGARCGGVALPSGPVHPPDLAEPMTELLVVSLWGERGGGVGDWDWPGGWLRLGLVLGRVVR